MKSAFQTILWLGLAAILGSGCAGYQLGSVKPGAYAGIERIHVPPFRNETLEPRLSSLVTQAVLKEIQADGTYQVANRANCDAVLVGVIRDVKKRQLRADRTDTLLSRELELHLHVEFHLEDPRTGARIEDTRLQSRIGVGGKRDEGDSEMILAPQGKVTGRTIQVVDPSFQVSERNAFSIAAQDLASKLVAQLSSGW